MNEAGLHFGHGTADAIDEAAALILHGLHLPPDLDSAYFEAALTRAERQAVVALMARRIRERRPGPYITRQAWFMGLPFYVDERVLIPRSPIAELIEHRFTPWVVPERVRRVLDLCTGSGCIGIACAHVFPQAVVDLTDVSADALAVARRNVAEHDLGERCQVIQSDLFAALKDCRYDLIVSNPPYVSVAQIQTLPPEYAHEPELGLVAGEQGLDVVLAILRQAGAYLEAEGILVVEVGGASEILQRALPQLPFTWLSFEHGGEGVFMLTAEQLELYRDLLRCEADD